MRSVDLRVLAEHAVIRTDVCIVGSGPAGSVLAQEVADGVNDVVVLESGGRSRTGWADGLDEVVDVGAPRQADQRAVRARELGGSSATWWGRAATFDPIDFRRRAWVPGSGWPIGSADLAPYLPRAAAHLGLGVASSDEATALLPPEVTGLKDADLAPFAWTYSRTEASAEQVMRFGDVLRTSALPGVRVIVNATVTRIATADGGGHVRRLEVRAPDGRVRHVEARVVVLCAGGIENARLLLASDIGNDHDLVGRTLMDHPRGPVATYPPERHSAVQRTFGGFRRPSSIGPIRVVPGLALDPVVQEREELLNCALWVEGGFAPEDPLVALRSLSRLDRPRRDLGHFARGIPSIAETVVRTRLLGRSAVRVRDALHLHAIVEQRPDPASRITLDDRLDAYGVPLARIDWKVGEQEARTVRRAARLWFERMRRAGLPVPVAEPWIDDDAAGLPFLDAAHPTGSTRMAAAPADGVVDPDLKVHGIDNLYVLGSSVFPTAGHANPTQMIAALAVRLGDHLRKPTAETGVLVTESEIEMVEPSGTRPVVLVTGANGTVGRRMVPALLDAGYAVRALTSKAPAPVAREHVEWRVHDLRRADLDFRDDLRGCSAVVHLAVEQQEPEDMLAVNAEATAALAAAAETEGVRFFCYTSSISVYGSSLLRVADETSPVLTAERDVPDEYLVRPALRAYGRSKLLGERAIARTARRVEYVVFRPTVIVDEHSVRASLGMGRLSRSAAWRQRTHALSVHDVVGAVLWALGRALTRPVPRPGVTTYNLSDELAPQTYGDLFQDADRIAGTVTPRLPPFPLAVGEAVKWVQSGRPLPVRHPMGSTSFPSTKLYADGYEHRHGLHEITVAAVTPDAG